MAKRIIRAKRVGGRALFCAAAIAALGATGCAEQADDGALDTQEGEEAEGSAARLDGPVIGSTTRNTNPTGSTGSGPVVGSTTRSTNPTGSTGGGPVVGGVTRDTNPTGGNTGSGPVVGDVTRDTNPTGGNTGSGPVVVGVEREQSPTTGSTGSGPVVVGVEREQSPTTPTPVEGSQIIGVERTPVTPTAPTPIEGPIQLGGSFTAQVTAHGTGCPAGTWTTATSPDGKTFTTTFKSYSAMVSPQKSLSVVDCQLGIKLTSAQDLSYAVESFRFEGQASLREGVSAVETGTFYIQGNPATSLEAKAEQTGQYEGAYQLVEDIDLTKAVWSPCGKSRDLNVQTRLRARQGSAPGVSIINGTPDSAKITVRVAARTCD